MTLPSHLLPRFHAWLQQNHIPPKKVSRANKIIQRFAPYFLKQDAPKPIPQPSQTITSAPYIHRDILEYLVRFIPVEGRRNWRLASKRWRDFVDQKTPFWSEAEIEMIQKEFPKVVINMFGGAFAIKNFPLHTFQPRSLFRHPTASSLPFEIYYRMTWIDPAFLKAPIMRGVDPNGLYYISLLIRNVTLNKTLVMTLQEGCPAFCAGRRHFPYGWVVSVTPYSDDDYVPFSGDFCLLKDREMLLCEESFITFIEELVSKGQVWRPIGTFTKVDCLFQLLIND